MDILPVVKMAKVGHTVEIDRFCALIVRSDLEQLLLTDWPRDFFTSNCCPGVDGYPTSLIKGQPALLYACSRPESKNNLDLIKWLGLRCREQNEWTEQYTPLHAAAFAGNLGTVEWLLPLLNSVNINAGTVNIKLDGLSGLTALELACASGHLSVVKALLFHGAELTSDSSGVSPGMATLIYAPVAQDGKCWSERLQILDLLKFKPDSSILYYLASRNPLSNDTVVWQRIGGSDEKLELNAADAQGNTPLHFAVSKKQWSAISYLLDQGNLFIPNKQGQYPYQLLFEDEFFNDSQTNDQVANAERCIHLVLKRMGSDLGCTLIDIHKSIFPSGDTVLHRAVKQHASFASIHLLVKGGADWMSPLNDNGQTPLLAACQYYPALVTHLFKIQQQTILQLKTEYASRERNQSRAINCATFLSSPTQSFIGVPLNNDDSLFQHFSY